MGVDKRAISLGVSALIVIAFIIIAGFGIYLNGTFNTTATVVTTNNPGKTVTTAQSTKATVTSSNSDLAFTVQMNSSTVQMGQVLGVSFDLFNTLDSTNNVTGAQDWQVTNASEDSGHSDVGWNCAQNDVFRIEVVSGYYSMTNYTSGTPLDAFIWQPPYAINQCLLYIHAAGAEPISDPNYGQNYYIFNPKSDVSQWVTTGIYTTCSNSCTRTTNGTIVGECNPCNAINQTAVMNETMMLKPSLFANANGAYTIVGGDEWGQVLILHFTVTNTGNFDTISSTQQTSGTISTTGVPSCSTTYSNGTSGLKLYLSLNAGPSVNICVRYFSYNPNGTKINTLDQLTIFEPVQSSGTLKNVNSSFSISASVPEIQIGGPTMANEGFLVTYIIKSTGSAPSGTYEIALSSGLYPDDEICGYGIYNILQVGNITNPIVSSSCHYIPSPQDNPGLVYSEVVGITNST